LYAAYTVKSRRCGYTKCIHRKFFFAWLTAIDVFSGGRETKIEMKGNWPDPSFTGIKIPETPNPPDSGIDVKWKYLNRNNPMVWNDQFIDLKPSAMGANLIIPVDQYDKTERSVKYALLCIILTFACLSF
jgi:inner membrane protein